MFSPSCPPSFPGFSFSRSGGQIGEKPENEVECGENRRGPEYEIARSTSSFSFLPRSCLFLASLGMSLRKAKTKVAGKIGWEKRKQGTLRFLGRNQERFVVTRGRTGT